MLRGKRKDKIAYEIKQIVAEAILLRVTDPRVGFVTITEAELSPDYRHVTVYASVMGTEKEKKSTFIALNYAKGFFQKEIADKLQLKHTPMVHFREDASVEEGAKIDAILKKIQKESPSSEEDN